MPVHALVHMMICRFSLARMHVLWQVAPRVRQRKTPILRLWNWQRWKVMIVIFVLHRTFHLYLKSVQSGDTISPLVKLTSKRVVPICLKCGTTKKSGKQSCCARGGDWFKQCGDAGDQKFDHTWAEGIQSCKRTLSRG